MLRTIFFFATFIPWTLFVIFTGVPLTLVSPNYLHTYSRFWGRVGLFLAGVRLQVEGEENVPSDRPVIYMSNHQSNFDILALFAALPGQFRWMAKAELFRVPLFGLAMRRSGYIPIERADSKQARHSLTEASRKISEGASVIVFPEGTRSPDGNLLPFKKGGFLLACHGGIPIVPVAICGSRDINPKGSLKLHKGTIRVRIFPLLETAGTTSRNREALMEKVRHTIVDALDPEKESSLDV